MRVPFGLSDEVAFCREVEVLGDDGVRPSLARIAATVSASERSALRAP